MVFVFCWTCFFLSLLWIIFLLHVVMKSIVVFELRRSCQNFFILVQKGDSKVRFVCCHEVHCMLLLLVLIFFAIIALGHYVTQVWFHLSPNICGLILERKRHKLKFYLGIPYPFVNYFIVTNHILDGRCRERR